jgi:hypothetical protein
LRPGRETERGSKLATLLPPSAAAGSTISLIVRLQDGPIYTYTFRAQGAPPAQAEPVKVTLLLKTKSGNATSTRVDVGPEVPFTATVTPRLPQSGKLIVHLQSEGVGSIQTRTCSVSPCSNGVRRSKPGTSILWATVVSSANQQLAKSAPVTVTWKPSAEDQPKYIVGIGDSLASGEGNPDVPEKGSAEAKGHLGGESLPVVSHRP